jgi:glycosyltransferase involved in cell wall biosynthesis
MLAALAGARSAGIDAGLWLIGAAGGAATELIEDHHDHSSVHHLGRLPYADVFPYLAAADVGLALLDPRMYDRGIPTKLFEYMGCGIPVIASDTRANRAYVDAAYGFVVPYEDTQATVNAISMLAEESDTRDRMGAAGRAAVEDHYSWEQEQSRLLDLYDDICESIA